MHECRKYAFDMLVCVIVLLGAGFGGWFLLGQPGVLLRADTEVDGSPLAPSLMWAAGQGLSKPLETSEAMAEFFAQTRTSLTPSDVAAVKPGISVDGKFSMDRLYLLYAVGLAWWVFGVSWLTIKGFLAFVYAVIALLTYGIFRLGMNRWLSLGGVVATMLSPVMLSQLPWLRSLCKAPFILAVILIAGYLLLHEIRPRSLMLWAILLGMTIGVGFGFRQDAIIGLPPALAVLLVGSRVRAQPAWPWRLAAVSLFGAAFVAPAWPMLRMTHDTGGNNAFYLLQGFASSPRSDVDMARGAICPIYTHSDYAVHALISDHYRKQDALPQDDFSSLRTLSIADMSTLLQVSPSQVLPNLVMNKVIQSDDQLAIHGKKAELLARRLVFNLYETFPADVLGRAYAATSRIVRNLQPKLAAGEGTPTCPWAMSIEVSLARHLDRMGLWYACAALLLLAAVDWRASVGALLLLLYFTGYTSLQFQLRHAFHLNLASFWFPLFLVGAVLSGCKHLGKAGAGRILATARSPHEWLPPLGRAALFLIAVVFVLAAPLQAARAWQRSSVASILKTYEKAELEPLAIETHMNNGQAVYYPVRWPAFEAAQAERVRHMLARMGLPCQAEPDVRIEYVVAEVETNGPQTNVSWNYEVEWQSHNDCYVLPANGQSCTLRFFFPIIKYSEAYEAGRDFGAFKGIQVGSDTRLRGLYRVRNVSDFPLFMTVWLPSDPNQIRWYQEFTL